MKYLAVLHTRDKFIVPFYFTGEYFRDGLYTPEFLAAALVALQDHNPYATADTVWTSFIYVWPSESVMSL